jgi:hypothetical protein
MVSSQRAWQMASGTARAAAGAVGQGGKMKATMR